LTGELKINFAVAIDGFFNIAGFNIFVNQMIKIVEFIPGRKVKA
jgi:hypothetical protein